MNLPVSLDRIKRALAEPPAESLKGLDERPYFRVQIQERQRFETLLSTLKFNGGPAVPGGNYGYEQQQLTLPTAKYPLMQPYSAFTQGQLATVASENVAEQYVAPRLKQGMASANRTQAEQAARVEVQRALAKFCSTHDCSHP